MDYAPYEQIVADALSQSGHRVLDVHIAPDRGFPEYLHLVCLCLGEPKVGTTLVRGDLDATWLRAWVATEEVVR